MIDLSCSHNLDFWQQIISCRPTLSGKLTVTSQHTFGTRDMLFWLDRIEATKCYEMVQYDRTRDEYESLGISWHGSDANDSIKLPLIKVGEKPTLFLDRDGVINVDHSYVSQVSDIDWMPGVFETLKQVTSAGIPVIVLTNQSGIGRGYYTEKDVHKLHEWMDQQFTGHGINIKAWYYCPYHPEAIEEKYKKKSPLRKPESAMLEMACADHSIDPQKSLMIGDKQSDHIIKAGVETWFIQGNYDLGQKEHIYSDHEELLPKIKNWFDL